MKRKRNLAPDNPDLRKSDREVCPICGRPAWPAKESCDFFAKCKDLAFGGPEAKSEMFRKYHGDSCGRMTGNGTPCRLDKDECHEMRVASIKRQLKAGKLDTVAYLEPEEMKELVGRHKCPEVLNRLNYKDLIPAWWREEPCKS